MAQSAAFMGQPGRADKVPRMPTVRARLRLDATDLGALYLRESRRFVLWLPVGLGLGIWLYFSLPGEPDQAWMALPLAPLGLIATGIARRVGWGALAASWFALMVAAGFAIAIAGAHRAASPMLDFPMGETVEGRVLEISRSASGAPRLLMDRVTVYGLAPDETPRRLRLTILDPDRHGTPAVGTRIRVYATLLPLRGAVEPGAFDFRRRAFFDGLGATGLMRGHPVALAQEQGALWDRARVAVAEARAALSAGLRAHLPGAEGAFAAAIIVGDRAAIEEPDAEALRTANLAHLLAISGLHMGILTGLIFVTARIGLSLCPPIALRWPTKKIAAVVAIAAGAVYLALSGGTVATQRAFVMVAVALLAVLIDRPALSLRAIALAAVVILVIRPVSLMDAGFQMSFAATVALVAGYEAMRDRPRRRVEGLWGRAAWWVVVYVGGLIFTSVLAGLATAPYAAHHFNRTAPWGLVANLAAVPVMGLLIAPAACIAGVLAPFGLEGPALRVMGIGIAHVLDVAHWVSGFPGAVGPASAAPPLAFALVTVGGLWLAIWRGRWRFGGAAMLALAVALWWAAPARPDLLIGPDGRLIGVLGPEGRALDQGRAQGFAAGIWLRRDGDLASHADAAQRPGLVRDAKRVDGALPDGWRIVAVADTRPDPAVLSRACTPRTVLVARNGEAVSGPCLYFGKRALRRAGSIAVRIRDGKAIVETANRPYARFWSVPAAGSQ